MIGSRAFLGILQEEMECMRGEVLRVSNLRGGILDILGDEVFGFGGPSCREMIEFVE